jgi:hypothetical protein
MPSMVIIVDAVEKLLKTVSNVLFSGYRIIGRAPVVNLALDVSPFPGCQAGTGGCSSVTKLSSCLVDLALDVSP